MNGGCASPVRHGRERRLIRPAVGEAFPSARVTGVDLSPIQPHWIPPNVEFIVDDIEDEWVHASDYDFAHFRFVNTLLRDNVGVLNKIFQ